ncbi:DUF3993 domain-containing protein [Falsibacillus albus]|uniref:DUF3993 domain-containing protein n=1 Tax=Falsibacillus albus TaxID=2478915 RepID=A0A3L7JIR0_9BACI|nr:DUF3993 domain-containing protein [Falsibacillus albus]RLQ90606.1 DUF3993 domain-containing protein [Falsibacillus albus]
MRWAKYVIGSLASICFMVLLVFAEPAWADEMDGPSIAKVKEAFQAQVSLSEKERTMPEVMQVLKPYFTDKFVDIFLQANLVKTKSGYQTFGSDFAPYYIPFFSYDKSKMKIVQDGGDFFVIEKFVDDGDGPVSFPDGYQGVKFLKTGENEWKIDEVETNIPDRIIEKADGQVPYVKGKKPGQIHSLWSDFSRFPIGFMIQAPRAMTSPINVINQVWIASDIYSLNQASIKKTMTME